MSKALGTFAGARGVGGKMRLAAPQAAAPSTSPETPGVTVANESNSVADASQASVSSTSKSTAGLSNVDFRKKLLGLYM